MTTTIFVIHKCPECQHYEVRHDIDGCNEKKDEKNYCECRTPINSLQRKRGRFKKHYQTIVKYANNKEEALASLSRILSGSDNY